MVPSVYSNEFYLSPYLILVSSKSRGYAFVKCVNLDCEISYLISYFSISTFHYNIGNFFDTIVPSLRAPRVIIWSPRISANTRYEC